VNRFWTRFIRPIVETTAPRRMMEIGADFGWNTGHLLAYCRASGCRLDIIDPAPRPELAGVLAAYGEEYTYLPYKSVDAIPQVPTPDIALIDGDHNWYTVHTELELLFARAVETDQRPPVVLFHDVGWPYGRRDMYYSPEDMDEDQRRPYAYRGLSPDSPELVEGGMNGMLANALVEGGPKNGVLTAIEDFVAEWPAELRLHTLPFFNGLGILVPAVRATPELDRLIESFSQPPSLIETVKTLERQHMLARCELAKLQGALTRRTDALVRARRLLAEQAERIRTLEQASLDTVEPGRAGEELGAVQD